MTLLDTFTGERGRHFCVEALAAQRLVSGNRKLAEELADCAEVLAIAAGQTLISQGADDNEIYFILAGTFDVVVNGRRIAGRGAGDHVGEMAAEQPPREGLRRLPRSKKQSSPSSRRRRSRISVLDTRSFIA
jgi:CRP/FNR family transcriptional regulator, cyclic AMP receptor protein